MCLGPSHPHCDQRVGKNQEYSAPAKPASQTAPASPASQTAPEGYSTRLRHPCTLQLGMQRTRAARERSCAVALLRCVSILREPLRELSKIGSMSWYNNRVGPQCDSTKFRVKNPWRCHSQMHHQSGMTAERSDTCRGRFQYAAYDLHARRWMTMTLSTLALRDQTTARPTPQRNQQRHKTARCRCMRRSNRAMSGNLVSGGFGSLLA